MRVARRRPFGLAPTLEGVFFLGSGLWPLLHLRSFEAVTGPKLERWLVKTVGLLVTAIGATLLVGARGPAAERTMRVLGVSSAAALAGIDLYYAGKRRINRVYLADAALELAIVAAWLVPRDRASRVTARSAARPSS